jgi:hypothetical protein
VEIASGGLDYANPDMLVEKYAGEGSEYANPVEALEAALEIAKQWKQDKPELKINIAHGFTGGYTMPFEPDSEEQLKEWAQKTYESLKKCGQCGEILGKETWRMSEDHDLGEFCSEYCADKASVSLVEEEHV